MKEIRYAARQTVPVLVGYLVLGMAFGLLLQKAGYNFLWALLISGIVFAGAMQFVLVGFLTGGISLLSVAMMTLSVNSRHIFYGISFIERFKQMGRARWYMIFSLTDETYSLLCGTKVPAELSENKVFFWIALLNHCYWVVGSVAGAVVGEFLPFNTTGIDFAMTALFVVIFVEQWLSAKIHLPALVGLVCGALCLVIFHADGFILPALVSTVAILLGWRRLGKCGEDLP